MCMLKEQTPKRIYCVMHTQGFQTYVDLMVKVGKMMRKGPLIMNGLVVLLFRRLNRHTLC